MTDQELINNIRNSDYNAFDTLFRKYYKSLVRYIRAISNDIYLAEDIVQQVFMTLWQNRNDIKINNSVKGYLYWVTYTSYINQYRKTKRRAQLLDDIKEKVIRDAIPEETEITANRIKRLKQIIETLPPVCKEVLELSKINGLKYHEIATRLNISIKTVESHMGTAFKKIRKGFENDKFFFFFIKELYSKCGFVK